MIYLDSSVVLAHLLNEDVFPPAQLWKESLVSSRLLEYETMNRLHAHRAATTHGELARDLLARIAVVELVEPVVGRASEPFPLPVRTLDALHLASMSFLRGQGVDLRLATYDRRLAAASQALGFHAYSL